MQRVVFFFIWSAAIVGLFSNAQRAAAEGYHNAYVAEFELPPSPSAPHPPQWVYVLPDGYPIHRLRGSEDKLIYYQPEEQYPPYPVASALQGLAVTEVETVDGVGKRTHPVAVPVGSTVLVEKPGFRLQTHQPLKGEDVVVAPPVPTRMPREPDGTDQEKPKDGGGKKDEEKNNKEAQDKGNDDEKKDENKKDKEDKEEKGNGDKGSKGDNNDKEDTQGKGEKKNGNGGEKEDGGEETKDGEGAGGN